ncbi:MAG: REDY-like protein HapK [Steroidobacteraceae bacterium]|nr:REDY-like protein HapK [Gammaproteobacteria bacterium]
MAKIIVLFNLKPGTSVADYEAFARESDLPIVNALPSVDRFEVLKAEGLLSGGPSPYQYIEIIDVNNLEQLGKDVSTETMQKIAATFRSMAEEPLFIITKNL